VVAGNEVEELRKLKTIPAQLWSSYRLVLQSFTRKGKSWPFWVSLFKDNVLELWFSNVFAL
jgi:phosphoglycerol transferase MdoB-like AlkP superfamily enzyme